MLGLSKKGTYCPLWAMPALWHTGLLLSFLTYNTCLEEECVLGIIGQPIVLPCLRDGFQLDSRNFSIEWRRDNEVVLRSVWGEAGLTDLWTLSNSNSTRVSTDAPQTGDFSLELTTVDPKKPQINYSLFLTIQGEEESSPLCTVCLKIAAGFSYPLLQREDPVGGEETLFMCHSSGGFPEPVVHWLINETDEPPAGSVRTIKVPLPDSPLYNITSHLAVNISRDVSVSCIIVNQPMNETLTSTSSGVQASPVNRALEAMWIFSTVLSVMVGLMVLAALVYQIHLDRTHKKRKKQMLSEKGYKQPPEETEETMVMNLELMDSLTETNV